MIIDWNELFSKLTYNSPSEAAMKEVVPNSRIVYAPHGYTYAVSPQAPPAYSKDFGPGALDALDKMTPKEPTKKISKQKEPSVTVPPIPSVSPLNKVTPQSVGNMMEKRSKNFGGAFAAARKAGLKQFQWNEKTYSTRTKEDNDKEIARRKKTGTVHEREAKNISKQKVSSNLKAKPSILASKKEQRYSNRTDKREARIIRRGTRYLKNHKPAASTQKKAAPVEKKLKPYE